MAETQTYRLLHTMIRVRDLDDSLDFYTRLLGMKLLRKKDYPSGRFTLAFVGYGDETDTAVVELTHNWDQAEPYDLGSGFGHLWPSACPTSMPVATSWRRKGSAFRAPRGR